MELTEALAALEALKSENAKLRTDAAEVPVLRAALVTANAAIAPAALDALLVARAAETAKATEIAAKRATIKTRSPGLAERVDGFSVETVEALVAAYAELPHPTMAVLAGQNAPAAVVPGERSDAVSPTSITALQAKVAKNGAEAFKAAKGIVL